ncbi:MAG: carboxypeptidase regulatory-like domain-containing protein [Flavobacteriales bacterium]|nr:carboxypeptidase regulatory-like domain-containing protein [Flavobacteriales bacterium]
MRHLLLAALALGSVLSTSAQSISGNLNTGSARAALGYGNVDIYKGDDLVASVLTDRFGNFNVSLDTGTYVCVVSYDGYESSTRTVKVRADEKLDLSMVEDASRPAPASRVEKDRTLRNTEVAEESYMPVTGLIGRTLSDREMFAEDDLGMSGPARGRKGPGRGILTAGEVNDFSKWEQWGDLSATVLRSLRQQWSIAPEGRYTLDLQSKSGLPTPTPPPPRRCSGSFEREGWQRAVHCAHGQYREGRTVGSAGCKGDYDERADGTGSVPPWTTVPGECCQALRAGRKSLGARCSLQQQRQCGCGLRGGCHRFHAG